MNKEKYEPAQIEITGFSAEDIILTSDIPSDPYEGTGV